jgi:hypothetical protein
MMKYREKFQIYLKIQRKFLSGNWQCCSNAVHYQLPLGFHSVFIDRGPSGYEELFRGFLCEKGRYNTGLSEHGNKMSSQKYVECHKKELCVVYGSPSIVTDETTYDGLGTVSGTEKQGNV